MLEQNPKAKPFSNSAKIKKKEVKKALPSYSNIAVTSQLPNN